MNIVKVTDGAYFVKSFSMQTLTGSYDQTTAQQILHGTDTGVEVEIEDASEGVSDSEDQTGGVLTARP